MDDSWLFHNVTQLFPDLNKVVLVDDDVVVQKDISFLWEQDLNGKVSGSVFKSWCEKNSCCPGNKYVNFLNFSHPIISSNFDGDKCAWLFGVNIFDLEAWRRSDITKTYHYWLKLVSIIIIWQLYFSNIIICLIV